MSLPTSFPPKLLSLIRTASIRGVKHRERVRDEAKTSYYVSVALVDGLGHDQFEIVPQKCNRGFIDYELSGQCQVEVKRFGAKLELAQIRRYLVGPRGRRRTFRIGILTNLRDWEIYGHIPGRAKEPIRLMTLRLPSSAAQKTLRQYVGAEQARERYVRLHAEYERLVARRDRRPRVDRTRVARPDRAVRPVFAEPADL